MDENLENKTDFKNRLSSFFNNNKKKIIFLLSLIIIIFSSVTIFKIQEKKNFDSIAEKYIEASLKLSSDQEESKKIFNEILLSKNKFYSIMALNVILEKELEKNKEKILEYFNLVESINLKRNQKDLILFKKSLFLLKEGDQEGEKILKKLIQDNSQYKSLAEEIIQN